MTNPTGRGGFKDHPENINREGAPRRDRQNWQGTIKRITDMTREEAIAYVGPRTRMGRLLKELPPGIPIKDALVFASIIHYGREPNARMLQALTDREEGKPNQPISGPDNQPLEVVFRYATGNTTTTPAPNADEDKE